MESEPVYAEVERRKAPSEPTTVALGHRRHLSACAGAMTSPSQTLSVDLQAAVDSLALLPVHIRRESSLRANIYKFSKYSGRIPLLASQKLSFN